MQYGKNVHDKGIALQVAYSAVAPDLAESKWLQDFIDGSGAILKALEPSLEVDAIIYGVLGVGLVTVESSDLVLVASEGQDGILSAKLKVDMDKAELAFAGFGNTPNANPGNISAVGDPVDTNSGAFIYDVTDLDSKGRGLDFSIKRFYRSRRITKGILGRGWSMPFIEARMIVWPTDLDGNQVLQVIWGNGTESFFVADTSDPSATLYEGVLHEFGKARLEFSETLRCGTSASQGGYTVRKPDGTRFIFCPPSQGIGLASYQICWLRKVVDVNDNGVAYKRNKKGDVFEVVDALGRSILFNYNSQHLLDNIVTWDGRVIDYRYSGTGGMLKEVEYPSTQHLDSNGVVTTGRVKEEYGYEFGTDSFLKDNLNMITRGGNVRVALNYYSQGYGFDRVESHLVDGKQTDYYYSDKSSGTPDPYDPRVTHETIVRFPDGEMETFAHGGGLLYYRGVFNGLVDSSLNLIPGTQEANGPSQQWMTAYDYNSDYKLLSVVQTSNDDYPVGRKTEYAYDSTNPDRSAQGNRISIIDYPDPSTSSAIPEITVIDYDPIINSPSKVTDLIGRVTEKVYIHQELPYSSVQTLGLVENWGILPTTPRRSKLLG